MAKIEDLINSVDIVEVLKREGVDLVPAGVDEYKALCPFHQERTPSFFVNPAKRVYHCFGCDASGNVITFLQDMYGFSFREAVAYLIDNYAPAFSLEEVLTSSTRQHEGKNALSRYLYKRYIIGRKYPSDVLRYLEERGVTWKTIKELGILPYVEEDFKNIPGELRKELNVPHNKLAKRAVIFPVVDYSKAVLGFIARNLETGFKKYINSNTLNKNRAPYLSHIAFKAIREGTDSLIVVEGIFDAVLAYQAGFKNVIAAQGTSLPREFIFTVSKRIKRIYLLFDKDEAGKAALAKAIGFTLTVNLEPYIFPSGSYFGKKDFGDLKDPHLIRRVVEDSVEFRSYVKELSLRIGNTDQALKLQHFLQQVASSIKSDLVRDAFEREFGLRVSKKRRRSSGTKSHTFIEGIRRVIYDYLRQQNHPLAAQFEPEDYSSTLPLASSYHSYIIGELRKFLDGASSYVEYFMKNNIYRLYKDPELVATILGRIYRKESLEKGGSETTSKDLESP